MTLLRDMKAEADTVEAYERFKGRIGLDSQIAHAHAEISEVYQAVQHGEPRERVLEEVVDTLLSPYGLARHFGFTDAEIAVSIGKKLKVLDERMKQPAVSQRPDL